MAKSSKSPGPNQTKPPGSLVEARQARLDAALRENLKRRKQQAKRRANAEETVELGDERPDKPNTT